MPEPIEISLTVQHIPSAMEAAGTGQVDTVLSSPNARLVLRDNPGLALHQSVTLLLEPGPSAVPEPDPTEPLPADQPTLAESELPPPVADTTPL